MDRSARAIGMGVFVLGIAVLIFVFTIAHRMFTTPGEQLLMAGDAGALGNAIALIVVRIALLFVITLAGSLIASRGIQLYLGSGGRRGELYDKPKKVKGKEMVAAESARKAD